MNRDSDYQLARERDLAWGNRRVRRGQMLLGAAVFPGAVLLLGPLDPWRPPYGGSGAVRTLAGQMSVNARRYTPLVERHGERLALIKIIEEYDSQRDRSAVLGCSDVRPIGYGPFISPWFWVWDHGRMDLNPDVLSIEDQDRLKAEIQALRREVARAIVHSRPSPVSVPPGYVDAYANGPGTMTLVSYRAVGFDVLLIAASVTTIVGVVMLASGRVVLRRIVRATYRCSMCGYSLHGLGRGRCPECGNPIA